jgi:hypothetical protein
MLQLVPKHFEKTIELNIAAYLRSHPNNFLKNPLGGGSGRDPT